MSAQSSTSLALQSLLHPAYQGVNLVALVAKNNFSAILHRMCCWRWRAMQSPRAGCWRRCGRPRRAAPLPRCRLPLRAAAPQRGAVRRWGLQMWRRAAQGPPGSASRGRAGTGGGPAGGRMGMRAEGASGRGGRLIVGSTASARLQLIGGEAMAARGALRCGNCQEPADALHFRCIFLTLF